MQNQADTIKIIILEIYGTFNVENAEARPETEASNLLHNIPKPKQSGTETETETEIEAWNLLYNIPKQNRADLWNPGSRGTEASRRR